MYVYMYVCMHVCMYVRKYIYITYITILRGRVGWTRRRETNRMNAKDKYNATAKNGKSIYIYMHACMHSYRHTDRHAYIRSNQPNTDRAGARNKQSERARQTYMYLYLSYIYIQSVNLTGPRNRTHRLPLLLCGPARNESDEREREVQQRDREEWCG